MMSNSHEKQIEVTQEHLDDLQHVNNVQYLSWVQDIAREHWDQLTPAFDFEGVWVVREHQITYKRQAVLGDKIQVKTYIKNVRGPLSERVVEFRKAGTEQILVQCSTQWCLLDTKNYRPQRVPDVVAQKLEL